MAGLVFEQWHAVRMALAWLAVYGEHLRSHGLSLQLGGAVKVILFPGTFRNRRYNT